MSKHVHFHTHTTKCISNTLFLLATARVLFNNNCLSLSPTSDLSQRVRSCNVLPILELFHHVLVASYLHVIPKLPHGPAHSYSERHARRINSRFFPPKFHYQTPRGHCRCLRQRYQTLRGHCRCLRHRHNGLPFHTASTNIYIPINFLGALHPLFGPLRGFAHHHYTPHILLHIQPFFQNFSTLFLTSSGWNLPSDLPNIYYHVAEHVRAA
jgi:hypothetical protein